MHLSIVTTMYRSAPYLEQFYARAKAAAEKITQDYEIIFVNDGSPDDSLRLAVSLYENDARVRVIDLSRNFGQHKAIMTGLGHARGDWVFFIDCDLEADPELVQRFYDECQATGDDVTFGVQAVRQDGLIEGLCGRVYYKLFNLLSTDKVPENLTTVRLMSRRFVDALLAHKEREFVIGGLWAATGFAQRPLVIEKRRKPSTTYNLPRKIALFVNTLTAFSSLPLVFIFYLGAIIFGLASVAASWLVVRRIFWGEMFPGWPSLMVSVWLIGGLTIFCLGLIAIYLSKVIIEVKQRPYTIVRHVYERQAQQQSKAA